jgi:hypothetical protein
MARRKNEDTQADEAGRQPTHIGVPSQRIQKRQQRERGKEDHRGLPK